MDFTVSCWDLCLPVGLFIASSQNVGFMAIHPTIYAGLTRITMDNTGYKANQMADLNDFMTLLWMQLDVSKKDFLSAIHFLQLAHPSNSPGL